jgi:hypothetical protein
MAGGFGQMIQHGVWSDPTKGYIISCWYVTQISSQTDDCQKKYEHQPHAGVVLDSIFSTKAGIREGHIFTYS